MEHYVIIIGGVIGLIAYTEYIFLQWHIAKLMANTTNQKAKALSKLGRKIKRKPQC